MNTVTAISLFSGAGGDTLGMYKAGVNVLGFVEFQKDAINTHKHNFPDCKMIGEDISKIPDNVFRNYTDRVDIIFGGFPCQSFSHGGKKDANDKRGALYKEFIRCARIIQPKIIIGENVKGILSRKGPDGNPILETILQEFTDIGYNMKYNLFNLKKYGIPQDRERVIIYGIRSDLDIDFNLANIELESPRFNRDIIEHSLERSLWIEKKEILKKIPEDCYLDIEERESKITLEPPTNLIKCYNKGELSFKKRSKSTYGCIIDLNDVSRTILSTYSRMPRLFVPVRVSYTELCYLRPYTVLELQRIQGFPDSFVFKGNYTAQVTQIGNAIAPMFVEKIMSYILGILSGDILEVSQLVE